MLARKTGLPICQHILLGLQLLYAREQLMDAYSAVNDGYPKSSRPAMGASRVLDDLDKLRTELDNQSANEHPVEGWSPNIYYGANSDSWYREVLPIWRQHQATSPECCVGMPEPTR